MKNDVLIQHLKYYASSSMVSESFKRDMDIAAEKIENSMPLYHIMCYDCGRDWWTETGFRVYCQFCGSNMCEKKGECP